MGVQVPLKGDNATKDLLVAPKYRDHITNKGVAIYRYKCDHQGCTMEYIGETGRSFGDRYRDHLRAPYPIYEHANTTGHTIKLDNFSLVHRGSQDHKGSHICQSQWAPLNRNFGKYQLPHIWDGVLQDVPALCLQWYPPISPPQSHIGHPLPIRGHVHII